MNADYVRNLAQTGDVLLVHGHSAEQIAIQVATCSPFCHVAQLLRLPGGALVVCEMLEPNGYQSMTFDDWLNSIADDSVYFGQAPDEVRRGSQAILNRQSVYKAAKEREYDFSALPMVWLSQITGKDYHPDGEVCSLLVADDWESTGFDVPGNAAPGSFLDLCESVARIK